MSVAGGRPADDVEVLDRWRWCGRRVPPPPPCPSLNVPAGRPLLPNALGRIVLVRDSGVSSSYLATALRRPLGEGDSPPFDGPARNGSIVGAGALASSKRWRRERGAVTGVEVAGVGNSDDGPPFSPGRKV